MKDDQAERTLKGILSIIAKDVRLIKHGVLKKGARLPSEDALTLTRYASALGHIVEDAAKRKETAKKNLRRKPTAELVADYLAQQKKPQEKPK